MGSESANKQKNTATSSSTTIDKMVTFVKEEFLRYEKAHMDRFESASEVIDQWKNKLPHKTLDWMNQVHCPITFASEQTVTPRIFAALFPNEAPLDAKVFGQASEQQGILVRDTLRHYFRISDVQGEALPSLTQNTLIGTGYVEVPYLYRKSWQVNRMGERYLAVVDRRPDCKSVNFFEMFPHPAKLKMDDGLPLIRRRFCDAEYLKRLAEQPEAKFVNLKEALETESTRSESTDFIDGNGNILDKKKRDEYELLEYWGPWDESYTEDDKIVTKKAVPYWITIVNRSVKVRGIPNPYNFQHPPYAKFTLFSESKPCWFGVGIGTVGKPTQDRLNKIINQRLDNVDLVLNKQGFYNGNDPLINVKKLQVSQPGSWRKVSDTVSSIRWMDTPDVTASAYKEEELAKADYREATGASAPLMPTEKNQSETAAGINLLQGAAGIRFRPVLKRIETDFIQATALMYLSHLQQFMVLPEWIKMTSNDGKEEPILVRPEDLQAKVQLIPTGISETLNKEVQIGQLLRFKEVSANDPTINQAELNRRIAELMGFKDINSIIVQQQPVMAGPGQLSPEEQQLIQQRLAEGASPDQIKLELAGNPPQNGPDAPKPGGQGGQRQQPMRGQTPEVGQPVQMPMRPEGMGMRRQ
jgi:hypothetical protein